MKFYSCMTRSIIDTHTRMEGTYIHIYRRLQCNSMQQQIEYQSTRLSLIRYVLLLYLIITRPGLFTYRYSAFKLHFFLSIIINLLLSGVVTYSVFIQVDVQDRCDWVSDRINFGVYESFIRFTRIFNDCLLSFLEVSNDLSGFL